jgi:hypothetical protein
MRILKTFCALLVGGSLMMGCMTWKYNRPAQDPNHPTLHADHKVQKDDARMDRSR